MGSPAGDQGPRQAILRVVLTLAPLVALLAVFGAFAFRGQPRDVGQAVPPFDRPALDRDGNIAAADLRGRPYAVNFWASWCVPCREEAPALARVAGDGQGTPAFLGWNILDGREEALAFVAEFGIRYPNVWDPSGEFRRFRVAGIPETLFVDRQGLIVGRYVGALDEPELRRLLAELVRLEAGEKLQIAGGGPSVGVP